MFAAAGVALNPSRQYRDHSDELDGALRGYVLANRVNEMAASPNSQRYLDYLSAVHEQWKGRQAYTPSDQYREQAKAMVPYALDAYEARDGVEVTTGLVFFHEDPHIKIAAQPDAMEGDDLGISVHCRNSLRTYRKAKEDGVTPQMYRQAQAMMRITGARHWLHLNYWQNPEIRRRKLSDHLVNYNPKEGAHLEEIMLAFLLRTRQER